MFRKTIVISLGGSLIIPDEVNVEFLKKFRQLILKFVKKGNRAIIVCGGGKVCRRYNDSIKKINSEVTPVDLDWMGIAATKLNAELVRSIFGSVAFTSVLPDPHKKINSNKKILVGAGFVPGSSSDKDAVLLAETYGASMVINLTNIDYVYTRNPKKFKNAKPIINIKWPAFRKIVGYKWNPGANVPFDPMAAKLAQQLKLKVIIINGVKLNNLQRVLVGQSFIGTIIS